MNTTTYGLDIAKTVFQLYWVEPSGKCFNRRFSRSKLLEFLANREPGSFKRQRQPSRPREAPAGL